MEKIQLELLREAKELGIVVDLLEDCATNTILLSANDRSILFNENGVPLQAISKQAAFIADNKQYCKRIFEQVGIPSPKSLVFEDYYQEKERLVAFMEPGRPYVCKPLEGTEGDGVCLDCTTPKRVEAAWLPLKESYQRFMLEEQIQGKDLRLQAVGGKLVAACHRRPATLIGDGKHSVTELLAKEQARIEAQNPSNSLTVDAQVEALVAQQNIQWNDILADGQTLPLRAVANMNKGATAFDITEEIHPDYATWITRIAEQLQQSVFALDVITHDHRQAPTPNTAWALEINGESYWLHHTFSEGRTHNIARLILKDTFDLA